VIRALRQERPDSAILLLGVPAERVMNDEILRRAAVPDVHNIADDRPIPEFLALLERAHSMVSVDTGPAHAAAALGVPTVTLFGNFAQPTLYRAGGPHTPVAMLIGEIDGRRNMLGIDAQMVIRAWRELTSRAPH
jgi:heptosyltransferase-2/heptosyltransferase-3